MKPGIQITKVWFDEDVIELRVDVSNGTSHFSNRVYVGYKVLSDAVAKLDLFKTHVHGGICDIEFGAFGPEYANGAFRARFHFAVPGVLYVTCKQESEYDDFSKGIVASKATLYLKSEPAFLDNFIAELRGMESKKREEAYFEAKV